MRKFKLHGMNCGDSYLVSDGDLDENETLEVIDIKEYEILKKEHEVLEKKFKIAINELEYLEDHLCMTGNYLSDLLKQIEAIE